MAYVINNEVKLKHKMRGIKMKRSAWQYYGVKIIYQAVVLGDPLPGRIDEEYSNTHTFFEESVILVHAQSFDHAYNMAEERAKGHEQTYRNSYGQTVEWKFIDAIDCFLIDDEIKNYGELYASITPVEKETTPKAYLMSKYAYHLTDYDWNSLQKQRCTGLQKLLTNEAFSKWRNANSAPLPGTGQGIDNDTDA